MPWVRIDENALTHIKVRALSDGAFRLWVEGLAHCQRHLTNGHISRTALRTFLYNRRGRVDELTASVDGSASLWEAKEDGFTVHDYLVWNESREHVLKAREFARNRIKKLRAKRRDRNGDSNALHVALQQSDVTVSPTSGVVCTVSTAELPSQERRAVVALESDESVRWFDRVYAVYPNKDRKQAANEAWIELSPDSATAKEILRDIQTRVKHGWVRLERRFIPQLRNYLKDRMWEDDASGDPGVFEDDPYARFPAAWQCSKCGEIHEGTQAQLRQKTCLKKLGVVTNA